MKIIHIFLLIFSSLFSLCAATEEYNIFCYWDAESVFRTGYSAYKSWHIDARLCTHVVLGSALSLDSDGSGAVRIINEKQLMKNDVLNNAVYLKAEKLKVIISVGNWKDSARLYAMMVADIFKRDKFYSSLLKFLRKWKFQGVYIDWEFPSKLGVSKENRENFVLFLEELKVVLKEHNYMLIAAVSARQDRVTRASYDVPKIAKAVDFINLITHDQLDPFGSRIGYSSPLYSNDSRSVEQAVGYWVNQTNAPEKLLLGVPLFVQTYTLRKRHQTSVGAGSKAAGRKHVDSQRPGYMTYGEFCKKSAKWHTDYDTQANVPYAYMGDQWASFENGRSISAKMHLVKEQHLGGVLAWSIDADDFRGQCGQYNGLLHVIATQIGNPDAMTTPAPTSEGIGMCPREGFIRNTWDCQLYYECREGKRTEYECIRGYYFDENINECKPAKQVKCNENFITWRRGMRPYSFEDLPLNLKVVN